ncbi:DoxX family membrane protein [Nocardioides sp. NPDC101246]|uniref:DoxX family protein n=1 Tax=Nocardioides sp. NPDC101246 TaxID=3364336 RepID=UPI003820992E
MAPLLILSVVTAVVLLTGAGGSRSWAHALRYGLAAMFTATGAAHFVGMRDELIAMVPPALPEPGLLVTVTGVLELLGAVGLVWRRTTRAAAIALGLMLIAMFPANVYAATHGLATEWLDHLVPRTILQIVFLAATVVVARGHRAGTRDAVR